MKINLLLAIESMIASFRKKIIILYFDFGVWMIKKFLIIILLAFFMISAVSASEIDEATFNNHAETQIQEFAEANQIGIVEEISTDDVIAAIHDKGKKITIWTVNKEEDIKRFMTGDADAIVTDAVDQSREIKQKLSERDPLEIIFQKMILSW